MNRVSVGSGFDAFVSPAAWTDTSQFATYGETINIVDAYNAYPDRLKKYVFSVGTTATTILPATGGQSYAYAENGGSYTVITSGTVTWTVGTTQRHVIVISMGTTATATIPDGGVWGYVGGKITTVSSGYNASIKYVHCQNLNNITSIVTNAFRSCVNLTGSLSLPSSLTIIENNTFFGCTGLTGSLSLPSGVTSIGVGAFNNCAGFTSLTLPSSLTVINNSAFGGCAGLTGSLSLPSSLTIIEWGAFGGCAGLTGSLSLPSSLTIIRYNTFIGCAGFTSLTLPSSLTVIEYNAFRYCAGLTSLTIPSLVTTIGDNAFRDCTGITVYNLLPATAPAVTAIYPFGNYAKPLHIPVTNSGYGVAPWNNTAIFSSIINDL